MPSKRKKNKRRMRRVQFQRRILEEQHAGCPPVKASPSIAVGAPGTVSKKAAKTPKPAPPKVQEKVPIAVPIVETPKIIPKVEPPKEEPVAKPAPVEVEVIPKPETEVVQEVVIPEVPSPVVTEEPVIEEPVTEEPVIEEPVTEEPVIEEPVIEEPVTEEPVIEAPPVEAIPVEVVQEVKEVTIPEVEPEIEVTLPAEAPVEAPAEVEVIPKEAAVINETEQTHDVCEQEPTAFTEENTSALVEEPITAEPEGGIVITEMIVEATVDATNPDVEADIEEVGSQSCEDSYPVEAAADEPEAIEPESTEGIDVIATEEQVEADVEDVASLSEESESVDSGPVEVVADEPESLEPESVEPEKMEEKTEAVPQEVVVTETMVCVVSEPVAEEEEEICSSLEDEEDDCEMEVLSDETPAETNHITENAPAPTEEFLVEQDAFPLPPLTDAPEPVTQIEEVHLDKTEVIMDDFVVPDAAAEVIEQKTIELHPVFEKPTVAVCEIFGQGPNKIAPEPELIPAAEDTLNDVAANKCFDVEEPEPCQIPLDQESILLSDLGGL